MTAEEAAASGPPVAGIIADCGQCIAELGGLLPRPSNPYAEVG
jgi:hypothetical protein